MTEDQLVEKVAKALYSQAVTIPRWEREQDSLRFNFLNMARNLIAALLVQGLGLVEVKPEVPEVPKPQKEEVAVESDDEKSGRAKRVVGKKDKEESE